VSDNVEDLYTPLTSTASASTLLVSSSDVIADVVGYGQRSATGDAAVSAGMSALRVREGAQVTFSLDFAATGEAFSWELRAGDTTVRSGEIDGSCTVIVHWEPPAGTFLVQVLVGGMQTASLGTLSVLPWRDINSA
jgi:hypothetical protein